MEQFKELTKDLTVQDQNLISTSKGKRKTRSKA